MLLVLEGGSAWYSVVWCVLFVFCVFFFRFVVFFLAEPFVFFRLLLLK